MKYQNQRLKGLFFLCFTGLLLLVQFSASAQLGQYSFTGTGACPNQNPSVTAQPANAVFSDFTAVGSTCNALTDMFSTTGLNNGNGINTGEYYTFTVTPNSGYLLSLTGISFSQAAQQNQNNNLWTLRSSIDNYTADVATGAITDVLQTPSVSLPPATFSNTAAVTFRLYVQKMKNGSYWSVDDVTVNGTVAALPVTPSNPTSDSPQCSVPGVTLAASGTPPSGETWYWQTTATGTSTTNNNPTLNATASGTYYLRSRNDATLIWSGAASVTVTVTPDVATPSFSSGATSSRCQGAATINYSATALNNTGLAYSLDAASISGGNTINSVTGDVTYASGWTGPSIITVTASGCAGPKTATHTENTAGSLGTPVFAAGSSSTRCMGAGTITYTATATNSTALSYSIDLLSSLGGNTINATTGAVTFGALWFGNTTITVTATGCSGTATATHVVSIGANVTTPVFAGGTTSTRCQGAGTVPYPATATNASGITYSLDATSTAAGNTINSATGDVTYVATWNGTTVITAGAAGCGGPKTATHTVTNTANVSTPVFTSGATSTRCQAAGTVTYTATATNSTSRTYSLDATSIAAGNTINTTTGAVTYVASWNGVSVITVTANGCGSPTTATHTASVTPVVSIPVFNLGSTSTRCQGAGPVTYDVTASNSTGVSYTLNAAALTGGNTINSATGVVTYAATWTGTTIITATAAGCSPQTATHNVTITPTVGTPVFTAGATSTRCQGAGTVSYTAAATNATGITYSLDATSTSAGNTINGATGDVTYVSTWSGTSIITASAAGCNGPKTASHTVTVTAVVGTPVFTSGATSTKCQSAGTVTYTAAAAGSTSRSYSLDATSIAAGNSINAATGAVNYVASWSGTTIITVTANGCGTPTTATHTVTVTPVVVAPVFTLGPTSTRCQGAGTVTYDATAINSTGITYSLNAAALSAGNSINAATGDVTYVATWTGSTVITATAAGCTPQNSTHTVTITPTVGTPVFISGGTSTRCQGATTITYTANATTTTGITYTLDAASLTAGNTINAASGAVTYIPSWTSSSIITASAAGCNGPKTATHTVTINVTVGATVFTGGATSTRCQGAGSVPYPATASNSTALTYALDAASITGGNTINSITGTVAYTPTWSGTSTITAAAAGCNGPTSAIHTVTITPTVGIPAFTGGATSTRCQGAGNVTYTATATNSTGITYSLDAASIAAGNSINAATGAVTYSATWNGSSVITASAAGCNGPKTSTRTENITPTVGTPVFAMGLQSVRTQAAGTVTYTATSTNSTAITYSLDAASISGGNTVNTATGAVTWSAGWFGTSVVTASAAGCNGPATATHIVNINSIVVESPLYLSTGLTLDRIDPVSTNITTTLQTADLSAAATTNVSFTLTPALCSNLTIKSQTIAAAIYLSITSGTMPVNPNITATLSYNSTTIITLTNPVYNSASGILSWSATLPADVTVPSGQAVVLKITTAQPSVVFKINHHSATYPSRISLLPVSTFIDFVSFNVYNAPYPGGQIRISGNNNTTYYARAVITTPFGYKDITGMDLKINPPNTTVAVTCVDSTSCTRTYEYPWTPTASTTTYYLLATAKEGYENIIKNSELLSFSTCSVCSPVAVPDSATGAGGAPLIVNVLANDYDPNNNIKLSSLIITVQPNNGTGYISNNKVVYLPNGTFAGRDTLTYQICDSTNLCSTAKVAFNINPLLIDPCADATTTHTYFIPYPEQDAYTALLASSNTTMPSDTIRTIISLTMPYPGMTVVWDEWEDGYEANALSPTQATTKVWGDGNPYNGIAPGYPDDIIPAGGSIILDNKMKANPRVQSQFFYDGKDKITSSGQIAITQVSGEPTRMPVQAIKTNVTSTADFGESFTVPLGQNFPSRDFQYTALFIRAQFDSTVVELDKDNNGSLETTFTLNEGESYLVNGGVNYGATVTSNKPVGVELNAGGVDQYSIRNAPIYPATWYSNMYYSPVPTSDNAGDNPKDTSAVMLYNSLNRPIIINWNSGAPANGTITIPAKSVVRFPLAYSTTAAYRFYNPTGEAFTAIEIVDSYTPVTGAQDGTTYDWSFNLISESRLTDFATTAWAPGGLDLVAPPGPDVNGNPIWVTPNVNTTIYVKWDGKVSGTTGSVSPCGLRYDVSYPLNALNYIKLRDPSDNDQSGLAVYTCNGAKIAAVYGEDPQGSTTGIGIAYWDVGTTILPFCKQKLIFANDDYARTLLGQPVTIPVLLNDFGYLAVVDPTSVTNTALLQPRHGSIMINANGTIIYTPVQGYVGKDTFEYSVCSTPSPIVCDRATVYVDISTCPAPTNSNIISGNVFLDKNEDGISNDGNIGVAGTKVYLYIDGNCNHIIDANEIKDSVTVDASGTYQFTSLPEKTVIDDFDGPGGTRTCNNGSDGNSAWAGNWTDLGDGGSSGFCVSTAPSANAEIIKDGSFSYALRLKNSNVSATRTVNLSGANYAFLSFDYRRKSATLGNGENVTVQASSNGTTFTPIYTITGDGTTDAAYVHIYNQDISAFTTTSTTYIRFITNALVDDNDTVYIDNVKIQFLKYPICYMTALSAASVPQYYHTTTVLQSNFTATSSQTCLNYYNYGIARNKVSVTGTLFNDANGLTDNLINGTAMGTVSGSTMYAYSYRQCQRFGFRKNNRESHNRSVYIPFC